MEKIKIQDNSGDRKYFTQLPSIILNHSTAIDQALYWQMKRYAGEDGKCFATQETLIKKMKIGRTSYNKSLNYLIKRGWIKYEGVTNGKTHPIKTYSIVDIWKQNIMEYEKIPSRTAVSGKKQKDTVQNSSKIPSRTAVEEEPCKEEPTIITAQGAGDEKFVNNFISLFGSINPSYDILFKRKPQREAAKRLIKKTGIDHWTKFMSWYALAIEQDEFMPKATTPMQLEDKLAGIIARHKSKNYKKNNTVAFS